MKLNSFMNPNNVTSGYNVSPRIMTKPQLKQTNQQDSFEVNFGNAIPAKATSSQVFSELWGRLIPKVDPPFTFRFESLEQLTSRLVKAGQKFERSANGRAVSVKTHEGGRITYNFRRNGSLKYVIERDSLGREIADYEVSRKGQPSYVWGFNPETGKSNTFFNFSSDGIYANLKDGNTLLEFNYGADGKWKRAIHSDAPNVGENGEGLTSGARKAVVAAEYDTLPANLLDLNRFSLMSYK